MRIGIVNAWFERGLAYDGLAMHQALKEKHDVFVLAQVRNIKPIGSEWNVPNLTWASPQSWGFPLSWAKKHDLDLLIFEERRDCIRLRPIREAGIKTLCYLAWESVPTPPESIELMNRCFTGIIAPCQCSYDHYISIGLKTVFFIPWGADLKIFYPQSKDILSPIRFFHPAGYGGVGGRKSTREVSLAFAHAKTGTAKLIITSQKLGINEIRGDVIYYRGTLLREDLAKLYRECDVLVLPSKWECPGLPFMEALASGLAIITVDAPPMSDYVHDGWNGYLCKTSMGSSPRGIFIPSARVDIQDLTAKIEYLSDRPEEARNMGRRSYELAKEKFDWEINKERLIEIVEAI